MIPKSLDARLLHEMEQKGAYNWSSTSADYRLWIRSTVFDMQFAESEDAKPRDMEG